MGKRYDLVCIGSGPAGQRAAVQAAKLGRRVAVVEKRRCVGGVCIETGTIPSKTFREAVRAFDARADEPASGPGPSFSVRRRPRMSELLRSVGRVIQTETDVVEDQLARNGVDLHHGHAEFRGPHDLVVRSELGSRTLHGDHFLLAVGTRPARPVQVDPDSKTIVTSDRILDMEELPRTMAVVGGGVIGVEYASMFAALGVSVTLVDRRTRLLEFLDAEISDELVHQMRNAGVTFRFGEAVSEMLQVDGEDRARRGVLKLESGKHIVADQILYSVGRVGATDDLHLDAVGLKSDERGRLEVDADYRTHVPHISAAGDVIGFPALAATSAEQGRLAACAMFGVTTEPLGDRFPVGIYAIPEISMVGATEEQLTADKVPYETGVARYREIARGQILGDDSGLFKMLFHRETGALLGVHCIGSGATELVHVGQAVLALGGGIEYFLKTVFNYPTLAECYKTAAFDGINRLD